ncbi:MAG: hypothetical protein JXR48_00010 [Candidatus Delongbacteria bacterium]|nr:hypothetical protein [Candidatus Delongbacteria bacterium]
MKVERIIILLIILVSSMLMSQDDVKRGERYVHVYIASLNTEPITNLEFNTNQTNPDQWFPVIFNMPDKTNPNEIISIQEYLELYGDTVGDKKKLIMMVKKDF